MQRNIIISGPQGSGKTWIASAIRATHKDVLITTAQEMRDLIENGDISVLSYKYSLMVIEECTANDIIELDLILNDYTKIHEWRNAPCDLDFLPIVYTTQEEVTNQSIGYDFHIIHCQNRIL